MKRIPRKAANIQKKGYKRIVDGFSWDLGVVEFKCKHCVYFIEKQLSKKYISTSIWVKFNDPDTYKSENFKQIDRTPIERPFGYDLLKKVDTLINQEE